VKFPFSLTEVKSIDRPTAWVALGSVVCLVGIRFFGNAEYVKSLNGIFQLAGLSSLYDLIFQKLFREVHSSFWQMAYWAIVTLFFYLIVPMLIIKKVFKQSLHDFGLKQKGMFGYSAVYLSALALILPVVVMISFSPAFRATYPFYFPVDRADMFPYFFSWECLYLLQFFGLEFFFRGFMIHGLKDKLGIYSVFVMTIPYCMIHFGKPLPECVGSIGAGLFLGMMSYKTGSVWMGAFLHMAVAISMDVLSLWHRGYF